MLAGTKSWKAFLFGSFDASNFITVDKPPASLWVMDLSARLFGVNAWSILVPQALEGVAAVGILYATVRRRFGHAAGLIAGAVLALTPVAVLMFRYDNPDSLLVLLLVGSAYALTRALEGGRTRWLLLAGVLVGFGFLTKMLGAFLVLPGFAAVYLVAAPVGVRRRIVQLLAAGLSVLVSAGWWVALVTLWPAADRPYIGGSTGNSELNLIFGYNGFGRLTGSETGSVGGGGGWGPTGLLRMFNDTFGGQASWLIPAALILGAGLIWLRGRAPRTDGKRAAALLWGSWLVITGAGLQPRPGDHPPLLHGRPGSGHRRAGRDGRGRALAAAASARRPRRAGRRPGGHRPLGRRAARTQPGLAALAGARHPGRRPRRRARAAGAPGPVAPGSRRRWPAACWRPHSSGPPPTPSTPRPPRTPAPSPRRGRRSPTRAAGREVGPALLARPALGPPRGQGPAFPGAPAE